MRILHATKRIQKHFFANHTTTQKNTQKQLRQKQQKTIDNHIHECHQTTKWYFAFLNTQSKKNKKNFRKSADQRARSARRGGWGASLVGEPTKREEGAAVCRDPGHRKRPNLRAKHTIFRKYGTKKPKNRPQKAKNRSPFMNPGETVEASKFGSRRAGRRRAAGRLGEITERFSH